MEANILDVARYIVWFSNEHGDPVTHLKLQKLCFYVEAMHLAAYDRPFTGEQFQAWPHGPVSRTIWDEFKQFKHQPIISAQIDPSDLRLTGQALNHINDVLEAFAEFSAYALERMTHDELPWIEARGGCLPDDYSNALINPETMRTYYKKFIQGASVA
jgi:uncharacterized phage-associated protein